MTKEKLTKGKEGLTKERLKEAFCEFFCKSGYIKNGEINRENRFSSQDECYNYFQGYFSAPSDLNSKKQAGLHLGFYLASYGMFRGSTGLLNYGIENFEKWAEELKTIYSKPKQEKEGFIDENLFTDRYDKIKRLICGKCSEDQICKKCSDEPKSQKESEKSKKDVSPTQTLITKIMLGVFGDFPAIDTNFNTALKKIDGCTGIYRGDDAKKIWDKISKVYNLKIEGIKVIEEFKTNLPEPLKNKFSDEKILDALFFTIGDKLVKLDKAKKAEAKKMLKNNTLSS